MILKEDDQGSLLLSKGGVLVHGEGRDRLRKTLGSQASACDGPVFISYNANIVPLREALRQLQYCIRKELRKYSLKKLISLQYNNKIIRCTLEDRKKIKEKVSLILGLWIFSLTNGCEVVGPPQRSAHLFHSLAVVASDSGRLPRRKLGRGASTSRRAPRPQPHLPRPPPSSLPASPRAIAIAYRNNGRERPLAQPA